MVYKIVKSKIQHAIAETFSIDFTSLHLTHPTFFSKLTNLEPKTEHDEYWHVHIDKVRIDIICNKTVVRGYFLFS